MEIIKNLILTTVGFILFILAAVSSITSECFHCELTVSHNIISITLTLISIAILSKVFLRISKDINFVQPNLYNEKDLVPDNEGSLHPKPQYIPTYYVSALGLDG